MMWLWHGTRLVVRAALRTSGAVVPFEIEPLSNTPARLPKEVFSQPRTRGANVAW